MATQEKTWNVANRLHSLKDSDKPEVNHIIAGADEIYDDAKGAKQSEINVQTDAAIADRYTKAQVDAAIADIDVTEQLADYAKKTEVSTAVNAETTRAQGVEATKANASDVATGLAAKQDVLTFDNTPTAGSTNPVTSGGVKAAIDAVDVSSQIAVETQRATNAETALGGRIDDVEDTLESKADAVDVEASLDTKQDTIADLTTIRSGAALGATAKQPATTLAGYGITDAYTKAEVNNLVSTPHQQYVTVATKADLDAITIGSADTIYRVSNYDGTQVDATKYAEYAWDGTQFMLLSVKSAVGEVLDVSEYNSGATYETLAAALAAVPESVQRGGMSIKFVQSPDNKYVQYRLMHTLDNASTAAVDFVNTANWSVSTNSVYITNNEFLIALLDNEGKVVIGLRVDGNIYYGSKVPQQIQDYVSETLGTFTKEQYLQIVQFIGSYLGGDGLADVLSGKVDKETGKSLLDANFASSLSVVTNNEFLFVILDSQGFIVWGIRTDGGFVWQEKDMVDSLIAAIRNIEREITGVKDDIRRINETTVKKVENITYFEDNAIFVQPYTFVKGHKYRLENLSTISINVGLRVTEESANAVVYTLNPSGTHRIDIERSDIKTFTAADNYNYLLVTQNDTGTIKLNVVDCGTLVESVKSLKKGEFVPLWNIVERNNIGSRFDFSKVGVYDYYAAFDELTYTYKNDFTKNEPAGYSTPPTEGTERYTRDNTVYPINYYTYKRHDANPTKRVVIVAAEHTDAKKGNIPGDTTYWYDDHGDSPQNILTLLFGLHDLLQNPDKDEVMNYISMNFIFEIIPIVNPWGCQNHSGLNARAVNLNRNADYNWEDISEGDYQHVAGSGPWSENETLAVKNLIESFEDAQGNTDVVLYFDCHARGGIEIPQEAQFLVCPVTQTLKDRVDDVTYQFRYQFDGRLQNYILPYTNGVIELWVQNTKNINSVLIESGQTLNDDVHTRNDKFVNYQMTIFWESILFNYLYKYE